MFSHVSFTSIPVDDFDRAKAFYVETLGLSLLVDAPMGEMRWVMVAIGDAPTSIHFMQRAPGQEPSPMPALPLIAPDVEATIETLRARGVEIVTEPKPAEWDAETTYALIRDTERNLVLIASK